MLSEHRSELLHRDIVVVVFVENREDVFDLSLIKWYLHSVEAVHELLATNGTRSVRIEVFHRYFEVVTLFDHCLGYLLDLVICELLAKFQAVLKILGDGAGVHCLALCLYLSEPGNLNNLSEIVWFDTQILLEEISELLLVDNFVISIADLV